MRSEEITEWNTEGTEDTEMNGSMTSFGAIPFFPPPEYRWREASPDNTSALFFLSVVSVSSVVLGD